jgi:hypothetical protein
MDMNRTGRFANGQAFTPGEKALAVMLVAGFFGYWAGFSLSAPGVSVGMPVTAAAAASLPASQRSVPVAPAPTAAAQIAVVVADDAPEATTR